MMNKTPPSPSASRLSSPFNGFTALPRAFAWWWDLFFMGLAVTGIFFVRRLFLPIIIVGVVLTVLGLIKFLKGTNPWAHFKQRLQRLWHQCTWVTLWSGVCAGLVAGSGLWGIERSHQIATGIKYLMFLGIWAVLYRAIITAKLSERVFLQRFFCWTTGIIVVGALINLTPDWLLHPRQQAGMGYQMGVALVMGLYWPFMYALNLWLSKKKAIFFQMILTIAMASLCFFGPMRSMMLSFILGWSVYGIVRWRSWLLMPMGGLVALVCGPILVALAMKVDLQTILNLSYDRLGGSAQHREIIWWETAHQVMLHRWLGWGTEAARYIVYHTDFHLDFIPMICSKASKCLPITRPQDILPVCHSHNGFLELLLEFGFVGFGVIVGRFLYGIEQWRRGALPSTLPWVGASIFSLLMPFAINYGLWEMHWVSILVYTSLAWAIVLPIKSSGYRAHMRA